MAACGLIVVYSIPWNGRVTGHGSAAGVGSHSSDARDLSDARMMMVACTRTPKPYCVSMQNVRAACRHWKQSREGRGAAQLLDGTSLIQS